MRPLGVLAPLAVVALLAGCGDGREASRGAEDPELGTALVEAAARGDVDEVRRLLEAGAPREHRDASGRTALLAATHENHVAVATALVEEGADVNAKDELQDSPYLYAAAEGRLEILRLTLANGADVRSVNRFGGTGLIPAAERGFVEVVGLLLDETDVDVDHVNNLGWTALLEAIILGDGGARHTEVVRLLLEAGADPDLADGEGVRPLAHARRAGHEEIARLLVDAGGSP